MDLNFIRAGIFLIAGLILILFPEKVLRWQTRVLKKLGIKHKGTERTNIIVGALFLVVAAVLFLVALF